MRRHNTKPKLFKDIPMDPQQPLLFPPTLDEFIPSDEFVRVFCGIIDQLDTSALYQSYKGGGAPAYEPLRMLKLLLFGFTEGVRSSRRLERMTRFDVRYMWIMGMSSPNFHTIAHFRRKHQDLLEQLFVQTVLLASKLGLVLLETVAVDGTKIEANVSSKQVINSKKADEKIAAVQARIERILAETEENDKADEEHDDDHNKPDLQKIRERLDKRKEELIQAKEELKTVSYTNIALTDKDSRVMKTRNGNRSAYNAQAAVDSKHAIIVAASVTQDNNDGSQMAPVMDKLNSALKRFPDKILADAGYQSFETLQYGQSKGLDLYVSVSKAKENMLSRSVYDKETDTYTTEDGNLWKYTRTKEYHGCVYREYGCRALKKVVAVRNDEGRLEAMRSKMEQSSARAIYKFRQEIVEPVFGQMKAIFGFRRLFLRGMKGACLEYFLCCMAHNVKKMAFYGAR